MSSILEPYLVPNKQRLKPSLCASNRYLKNKPPLNANFSAGAAADFWILRLKQPITFGGVGLFGERRQVKQRPIRGFG